MKGWLYSNDCPEGAIFANEAYAAKKAAGWVDSPALLHNQEPAEVAPERPRGKPGPKPKGAKP